MTKPTEIVLYDRVEWRLNNEFHRENGPAVIWDDGERWWCLHGKFHREDGPAIECIDGHNEYWLNDERHTEEGWFRKIVHSWQINVDE